MSYRVTLIPGDGIGPEITVASIRHTGVALKGPLTTPVGTGFRSVNVALRREFGLYANVRPAKTLLPGGRYENVDIVLIRENTEGLYVGYEMVIPVGDDPKAVAQPTAVLSRVGCERIVRFAFDYALQHHRHRVTVCHKANILKVTSGLFLEVARAVSEAYTGRVEVNDVIIDAAAMKLVLDPTQFDVIVTTNMFGDILSDQIAGLVGGLGLAPGANIGERAAIFEAVHGSAPDIAGRGVANPSAVLLAACLLPDHLDESIAAERIRHALEATLRAGDVRTPDLGGNATIVGFTDAVLRRLG